MPDPRRLADKMTITPEALEQIADVHRRAFLNYARQVFENKHHSGAEVYNRVLCFTAGWSVGTINELHTGEKQSFEAAVVNAAILKFFHTVFEPGPEGFDVQPYKWWLVTAEGN